MEGTVVAGIAGADPVLGSPEQWYTLSLLTPVKSLNLPLQLSPEQPLSVPPLNSGDITIRILPRKSRPRHPCKSTGHPQINLFYVTHFLLGCI